MKYEEKFKLIDEILQDRRHLFIDVEYESFIDAVILANNIADYLGLSAYRLRKLTKVVFLDKPEKGKLINHILSLVGLKCCRKCDSYLYKDEFRANSSNPDGLNSHCRDCQSLQTAKTQPARQAKYNAAKLKLDKEQAELDRQAGLLSPLITTLDLKDNRPIKVKKVKKVKVKPDHFIVDLGNSSGEIEGGADLADRLVRGVESEIEQRGARSSITERAGADFADAYISGAVAEFDSSGKDALKDSVDGFNKLLIQSIADIQIDALVGLGEAIGDALSGGQNVIPNLFGAIFNSVGTQIQNLGKYLIKAAIEVKAAKEAFAKIIGNFPLAIVAGVGLIALGAILKKQATAQFPGFATGVRNFKGGTALVGERGPELVNLPQGSDVIPNRALQGTSAGGGNVFIAESVIRGTDLVTIFNRATAQNRRNG